MVKIVGKEMHIPQDEEHIGFVGDNNTGIREFEITDKALFDFNFKLDLKVKEHVGIVDLEKVVEQARIILTWKIKKEHIPISGMLFAQLRAFNDDGDAWHSERKYFWISSGIKATEYFPSPLPSEFEQMEQRVTTAKKDVINAKEFIDEKMDEITQKAQVVSENTESTIQKATEVAENAIAVNNKTIIISNNTDIVQINTETVLQKATEVAANTNITQTKTLEASAYAETAVANAQNAATSALEAIQTLGNTYSKQDLDGKIGDISSLSTVNKSNTVNAINELADEIDILNLSTTKKYGARRVRGTSFSALERIWDAEGLVANAGVDNQTVINDFDNIYPWSHIRRCNIEVVEGEVVVRAYEGEPSYTTDGSNGNVAVEVPKFYICPPYLDDTYEYWGISDMPVGGWYLSPNFIGNNGQILDKAYFAAYDAARISENDTSKLVSYAGLFPETSRSRSDFRALATETDACCHLVDYSFHSILRTLFTVEFATLNSQAIMRGATTLSFANDENENAQIAETQTNRIVLLNNIAEKYVVGQTIAIGSSAHGTDIANSRVVTSIENYDTNTKALYFDGTPVDIAIKNYISSRAWKTGMTDFISASCGSIVSNTAAKFPCVYRGIENPWGNSWDFLDGINVKDYQSWVCTNPVNYADNLFEEPYRKLNYLNASNEGYIKTMGYDSRYPCFATPIEIGANTSTHFSDYYLVSGGERVVLFGGGFNSNQLAGLWCIYSHIASSSVGSSFGARVAWKPL